MSETEQLEQAIAALEAQRAILGDSVVDTALAPMREKLASLRSRESGDAQRKLLTVLFADISGYTALSEKIDAEEVGELMNALWQRLDPIILMHGGAIDKHVGDGVMALWGADQAREDDTERAIRAALEIQTQVRAYAAERGIELNLRIGLNTGPVVLGSLGATGEITALGDTVNLASRLEKAAPPGAVLISHDTYRHVLGIFDVVPQDPLKVKGKEAPVHVYVVERAKPRSFHMISRGVQGMETQLIGRDAELDTLKKAWEDILKKPRGRLALITGEAGLGKSRLLYELATWQELHHTDALVFRGRATQELGRLPYFLVRDMMFSRLAIQDSDAPAAARAKLEQGLRDLSTDSPELEERTHFIGHLIGLDYTDSPHLADILGDPQQIHDRAFHYLAQFFAALSAQQATIIYLEDIHWADPGSLELIEFLVETCQNTRLLVVCIARPALFERQPGWGARLGNTLTLDLAPLNEQQTQNLVHEILQKVDDIPVSLTRLIVNAAEGNPFYVEELIKMMIDEGVIEQTEERWLVHASTLDALKVPPTLTGVLQARLDSLPAIQRATLQRASVIGRVFWDQAVWSLADEEPDADTAPGRDLLADLSRKELIYRRGSSAFSGADEFIFRHALMHDVTYETVLKRMRRTYHNQAAQWLIERSGERTEEFAGLIAEHFERAGELAQAAAWYGRAGDQARLTYAPEAAIHYYRRAIQIDADSGVETPPELRIKLYDGLGDMLWMHADYERSEEAFTNMLAAARQVGSSLAEARAYNGLANVLDRKGQQRGALEAAQHAEEAARRAKPEGDSSDLELAEALYGQGWALHRLGETATALSRAELALSLCDGLGRRARRHRARCLTVIGSTYWSISRMEEAQLCFERAFDLYTELSDRRGVARSLNNLGAIAWRQGDYTRALEAYEDALGVARAIGDRDQEAVLLSNLAGARVGLRQYAVAEKELHRVLASPTAAGSAFLTETYTYLSEACLGQGRPKEALEAARAALKLAEDYEMPGEKGMALRAVAEAAAELKDETTDPVEAFNASLKVLEEIGLDSERARTLRAYARFLHANGNAGAAKKNWEAAKKLFAEQEMTQELHRMDQQPLE